MTTKTSGEIEQEFLNNLKTATGKDLKSWLAEIDGYSSKKRNDIIKWLKEKNDFGHMNASLLTGVYLNGGKAVYGNTDDLLETQFAKAEAMRGLYTSLLTFVAKHFPNSSVLPKKTYVSIFEKREFAALNLKPKEIRIGFDLGSRPFDEVVTKSKLSGPMPRISHMVVLTDEGQFDDQLVELLRQSRERCH